METQDCNSADDKAGQSSAASACSAADPYIPAQCLRDEVKRFKQTNKFTPMEVTGFYLQAAVVLDEHEAMAKALKTIRDYYSGAGYIGALAASALPPNAKLSERE